MKKRIKTPVVKVIYTTLLITILFSCSKNDEPTFNGEIGLSESQLTMNVTDKKKLTTNDIGDKTAIWSSQDQTIVAVDQNGKITAKNSGTTVVTVKIDDAVDSCEITVNTTLFISGHEYSAGQEVGNAKLWVNDEITALGNDFTRGMEISNGNSYVVGTKGTDGFTSIAKLWIDKVVTDISGFGTYASTSGIAINGEDVYVSGQIEGSSKSMACYWKNNVKTELSNGAYEANAEDIFVTNTNDVYIVGTETDDQVIPIAKLWQNGTSQFLSNSRSRATSIDICGEDVYVGGNTYNINTLKHKAVVWKNGVANEQTTAVHKALVYDVLCVNGDVYAVGYSQSTALDKRVAVLWKNGFKTDLTDGTSTAYASTIEVVDGDVYIGGSIYNGTKYNGVIWKNGVIIKNINTFSHDMRITGVKVK